MPKSVAANISENRVGNHGIKFKFTQPGKSEFEIARIRADGNCRYWIIGIRPTIAD
jgi:hypothetical protein